MQSAGGERGEKEAREESPNQNEAGSDTAAESCEATVPTAPECGSQNQPGPEHDDLSLQLLPDHSGADDNSPAATNSVQENATQAPLTLHLSNLNISEDMEDQEALAEDEEDEDDEFLVLDSEHPLVRRQQAALSSQLSKQLERINLGLKEKLAKEKADTNHIQETGVEMFRVQEQLARLQTKLDDHHHTKAQAEAKHQQVQDQLESMKSQYSRISSQNGKAKANVSQLQAETDNLMLHLTFTQGVSEDLRSNVKVMKNARFKAGVEKNQAEDQKLKQDLYVERLTKDMERLTQHIAMSEAQANAQAEETQAAKEAHSEAEMEMESLVMARKQLLQQWSSSLIGMKRRDEAFSAMQEAMRTVEHQVILLDREIEGVKRSITEEQEQNETLTVQLNWSQMDGATSKKLISQKQAQQQALQAHYSTCLRSLRETERTFAKLTKDISTHHVEVNDQRRQLEKESALRLESEEKIMTHIQQELTHNTAAKFSKRLTCRIATLKKQKRCQLWQLENDVETLGLESSEVSQHLDSLTLAQEALDEEIAKYNELMTSHQTKISSFGTLIGRNMLPSPPITEDPSITARTGHEDLSPLQIQIEALMTQMEELAANIKSDQQLWMKRQGTLVGLTEEIETNSRETLKLQIKYTGMQQKNICLESQIEVEHREETELDKNVKILRGDLLKLNTLLSKNGELSQALQQNHSLMETEFLHRLKEAEREAIEMHMKHENTQEEKERLLNSLVEAERQIMLWEKKTQLIKETRSAVASEVGQGDIQMMKTEIHRMEVRLNQLMKQQERLLRESEATVERRETIVLRREAIVHSSNRQTTKGELNRITKGLQRKIQDTHKHVVECEQVIRELQMIQESVSNRLAQQKQQLIELCGTSYALDPEFENLHDTKDRNLAHLVALQSRSKKLRGVCEGSYNALSTSESVGAALQSQMERVHAASTILHRVCEEFPQHQRALHRLSLVLEARTQSPHQGVLSEGRT
ncbi:coiled-coil domain-containing protein 40 [Cyclopterus lumpus]|uniref:coiled-coil domain-containing protein 40 n=1 Tax=Cyclopterus lumpus TaxID=8103 RepID=UPI0014870BAE|nr:coiled-coil domain-containing protein 40 [Cyclopterus lumpus]